MKPLQRQFFVNTAWLGILGGVFALLSAGCGPRDGEKKRDIPLPSVAVEEVAALDFERVLSLTATVEPAVTAILSSPAEGPVVFADIREGDTVASGQELFRIGRRDYADAALASARAELMRQNEDFRRTEQLVKTGAVSKDQLDQARSNLEKARAGLAQAQQQSEDYAVFAPWPGTVSKVITNLGNYVAPRTPMAEIYDPKSLVLRFAIPEDHALHVQEGLAFSARFDAIPDESFDLRVERAYGDIDRRLRVRFFEAGLPEGREFIPGMFARLRVPVETISHAVTVPEACVLGGAANPFVFVVADGAATMRRIHTGPSQDGRVVVAEGLRPGEQVVVQGFERIQEGTPVKVMSAASDPAESSPAPRP
jgi:membrane fusion protein, multidrug efflux system